MTIDAGGLGEQQNPGWIEPIQNESERDRIAREAQNHYNDVSKRPGATQSEIDDAARTAFHSPENTGGRSTYGGTPSANVGGSVGAGKEIHDFFSAGQKDNDAQQASNDAAMNGSLANMKGDRGVVSPENPILLAREAAARKQQGQAVDLARDAAMGNAPSAADFQTRGAMDANMAGQSGAAGAARGLSALNGVQGSGAAGAGMNASNIAMTGGMGRSQEMGQNIGMYGSMSGDMRSGDLGRVNQSNQNALANQDLNDNWKLGNAGLAAKQGQLGVSQGQMDDAWYGASQEPTKRQMGYDQEMNAIQAGANAQEAAASRAKAQAAGDRNRQLAGGAVAGGLTIVGTAAGGPAGGALGGMGGGIANSYITDRKNF